MKNVSKQILMFSIIGLLFGSCSRFSDVSIVKRHYRSGYHVEVLAQNPVKKQEASTPEATIISAARNEQTVKKFRAISSSSENAAITKKEKINANQFNRTISGTPLVLNREVNNPNKEVESTGRAFLKNEIVTLKHKYDGERHHTLGGLLWFIVVLLLILFLLNFILTLNLGGLVYVILVVALILLLFRLIGML